MNDPALFDVTRTTTAQCPVCGATRDPDEDTAPDCQWERDRQGVDIILGRRPKRCLNTYDPATAEIPY